MVRTFWRYFTTFQSWSNSFTPSTTVATMNSSGVWVSYTIIFYLLNIHEFISLHPPLLSVSLAVWVEKDFKCDRYLAPHARYFIREMRIKAYTQLLESYRSLSLSHMAHSFGVSVEFMDRELSRFIASGRLHCRIDKVGGVVETNRPDSKNFLYQVYDIMRILYL